MQPRQHRLALSGLASRDKPKLFAGFSRLRSGYFRCPFRDHLSLLRRHASGLGLALSRRRLPEAPVVRQGKLPMSCKVSIAVHRERPLLTHYTLGLPHVEQILLQSSRAWPFSHLSGTAYGGQRAIGLLKHADSARAPPYWLRNAASAILRQHSISSRAEVASTSSGLDSSGVPSLITVPQP